LATIVCPYTLIIGFQYTILLSPHCFHTILVITYFHTFFQLLAGLGCCCLLAGWLLTIVPVIAKAIGSAGYVCRLAARQAGLWSGLSRCPQHWSGQAGCLGLGVIRSMAVRPLGWSVVVAFFGPSAGAAARWVIANKSGH